MPHLLQNIGATKITFTPNELAQLNSEIAAIDVQGARMPPVVAAWSGVEAPWPT